MTPGESRIANLIVRNTGDNSWTAQGGYQLLQGENDTAFVSEKRILLDDSKDEIATYGGIFRGRPKVFQVSLQAPNSTGTYATSWQMTQTDSDRFGERLDINIEVKSKSGGTVTLGELNQIQDGNPKLASFTT